MRPELQTVVDNLVQRGRRRGFVIEGEIPAEIRLLFPSLYRPDGDFRKIAQRVREGGVRVAADVADPPLREFNEDETPAIGDPVGMYMRSIGRVPRLTLRQEVKTALVVAEGRLAAARLEEAGAGNGSAGSSARREKARLAREAAEGRRAAVLLVEANLRLVVKIARGLYRKGNVPLLDLVQEGNLGLMRAVDRFDYRLGFRFSTYSAWWIKQAIFRGLDDQGRLLRLPSHITELAARFHSSQVALYQKLGRTPTVDELSLDMGMERGRVEHLREVLADGVSLDAFAEPDQAEIEGAATTYGRFLTDQGEASPVKPVAQRMLEEYMALALECLDGRQRDVILLRYGLADGHPRPLKEVAEMMRVSPERVRQMEIRALEKLRQRKEGDEEFAAYLWENDW